MDKLDKAISVTGLAFGIDGGIISTSKYKKMWNEMFELHNIDRKYKTKENCEMFCYLRYNGMDAEAMFLNEIRKIDMITIEDKKKQLKKLKTLLDKAFDISNGLISEENTYSDNKNILYKIRENIELSLSSLEYVKYKIPK